MLVMERFQANQALIEDIGALNQVIGEMVERKNFQEPNSFQFAHETEAVQVGEEKTPVRSVESGPVWTPQEDSLIGGTNDAPSYDPDEEENIGFV